MHRLLPSVVVGVLVIICSYEAASDMSPGPNKKFPKETVNSLSNPEDLLFKNNLMKSKGFCEIPLNRSRKMHETECDIETKEKVKPALSWLQDLVDDDFALGPTIAKVIRVLVTDNDNVQVRKKRATCDIESVIKKLDKETSKIGIFLPTADFISNLEDLENCYEQVCKTTKMVKYLNTMYYTYVLRQRANFTMTLNLATMMGIFSGLKTESLDSSVDITRNETEYKKYLGEIVESLQTLHYLKLTASILITCFSTLTFVIKEAMGSADFFKNNDNIEYLMEATEEVLEGSAQIVPSSEVFLVSIYPILSLALCALSAIPAVAQPAAIIATITLASILLGATSATLGYCILHLADQDSNFWYFLIDASIVAEMYSKDNNFYASITEVVTHGVNYIEEMSTDAYAKKNVEKSEIIDFTDRIITSILSLIMGLKPPLNQEDLEKRMISVSSAMNVVSMIQSMATASPTVSIEPEEASKISLTVATNVVNIGKTLLEADTLPELWESFSFDKNLDLRQFNEVPNLMGFFTPMIPWLIADYNLFNEFVIKKDVKWKISNIEDIAYEIRPCIEYVYSIIASNKSQEVLEEKWEEIVDATLIRLQIAVEEAIFELPKQLIEEIMTPVKKKFIGILRSNGEKFINEAIKACSDVE